MELRGVERGQSYEYCQILSELGRCLNETASKCHANVRFHALRVYKEKHWKNHRCDSYTFGAEESTTSCPLWQPIHDHSRLRYCALFGHPHLRKFDGEFQACERQGTYPMLNNRYFTIQVTYLAFNDQETSSAITS
uniref:Repulsive guidance molecule N-terminal domain-containing protein n=1 Tax=Acrobeloides nanus TaxID=290746 RepID=A0A914DCU5_9BILA